MCEAERLIKGGYEEIFGHGQPEYWETMKEEFGISPPPRGAHAFGLCLFGDEAEIYKDGQYMALQWSSEHSPFWTDPKKSRYLICLLPVHSYAMQGQVNLTVQEALRQTCVSINKWQMEGVCGVHTRFVSLKGDWKWLTQALNLDRKPGKDAFCFLCEATCSMEYPMTDLSDQARWKNIVPSCPWSVPPSILELQNFSLATVGLDVLHLWHIGTGRDLAASALLILLRTGAFQGPNVAWLQ